MTLALLWHHACVSEQDLDELIEELRSTIGRSASLSDDDRSRLDGLIGRVEASAASEEDDDGLLDHLEESLSRFETEHVDLVATINRIANVLSAGGI